jgi:hypothetical protein
VNKDRVYFNWRKKMKEKKHDYSAFAKNIINANNIRGKPRATGGV